MSYITLNGRLVKVRRNKFTGGNNVGATIRLEQERRQRIALKGKKDGNCNVTACQKPGATWWNASTRAYYCPHCAAEINRWSRHDEGYEICFTSEAAAQAAKESGRLPW